MKRAVLLLALVAGCSPGACSTIPLGFFAPQGSTFEAFVSSVGRNNFTTSSPWTSAFKQWVPADVRSVTLKIRNVNYSDGTSPGGTFSSDMAVGTSSGATTPTYNSAPTVLTGQTVYGDGTLHAYGPWPVTRGSDGKIIISYTMPTSAQLVYEDLASDSGGWYSNIGGGASAYPLSGMTSSEYSMMQVRVSYTTGAKRVVILGDSLAEGKSVNRDSSWSMLLQTSGGYAVDNTGSMGATLNDWQNGGSKAFLRDLQIFKGAICIIPLGTNDFYNGDTAANAETYFTAVVSNAVAAGCARILAFDVAPFGVGGAHCAAAQTFNAWELAGRPNVEYVLDVAALLKDGGNSCLLANPDGDGVHWPAADHLQVYNALISHMP